MRKYEVIDAGKRKLTLRNNCTIPAQFPEDAAHSEWPGQNDETPTLVVHNATDTNKGKTPNGTWQGCDNVAGIVIINEIDPTVGEKALDVYETDGIEAAVKFLIEAGFRDQYTTSTEWFDKNLTAAGRMVNGYTGLVKRDSRDMTTIYRREDGQVVVEHSDGERVIDDAILTRTYLNADGSEIDPATIS